MRLIAIDGVQTPHTVYHLGRAYQKAGQKELTREALTKALASNQNFAEAKEAKKAFEELAN